MSHNDSNEKDGRYSGYQDDLSPFVYHSPEDFQGKQEFYVHDYDRGVGRGLADHHREYTGYEKQGLSYYSDKYPTEAKDTYSRTILSDLLQGALTLLIFVLALLPPLVYFLAFIKIKEGHISWLYMTTVTLVVVRLLFFSTLGPDGPQLMPGLSIMCLLFVVFSYMAYKEEPLAINEYVASVFTPIGGSSWQKSIKFYSVVLVFLGFCPLLWLTLELDMSIEHCHGRCSDFTLKAALCLMVYAMVCTLCNGLEAMRKCYHAGGVEDEGRRYMEMHGDMREDETDNVPVYRV